MNLLASLSSLARIATGQQAPQTVQISFTPALPPQVRVQIASQSPQAPFTLTVSGAQGNQLTFTSSTGATFTATVNPPLPTGTQLQLSVADALPQPTTAAPATPLPLAIQAKIITPQPTTPNPAQPAPVATPQVQILPAPTPGVPVILPAAATPQAAIQNLVTTTILQTLATGASQSTASLLTPNSSFLTPPQGPVAATFPTPVPVTLLSQPLILTPTAPMQPNGQQTATLKLATPAPTPPGTQPTPQNPQSVTLNLGVPLPVGTPQQAILLPTATPQPTLILTTPTQHVPTPPPPGLQLPQPVQQANTPQAPLLTPNASFLTPTSARILPPLPGQPADVHTALLANGTTIAVKSLQPLPTGSILVADFPITPTSTVQRVLSADTNPQAQPNITSQGQQAAAPVQPQTQHAILPPNMVVQGTITGLTESGQPVLTLSAPPQLAGLTTALQLPSSAQPLPLGAQLTLKVGADSSVSMLALALPQQAQSAFTVSTLGSRWEALTTALSTLQTNAPAQAAAMRSALPQLAGLLPGLMHFMGGLRTNNPDDIFDAETTKLLKSLGIDLSSDISQLSQLAQRHNQTDWRGVLFPYVESPLEDPRQGGFFWRREKSDDPRAPTSTRFVVELEMSQLGQLQLDGLVTYPEIWLKLRRTSAPEPGFTEGLQTMVNAFLQTQGLTGGIAVESTASFPVDPRADLLAQTENPLPTTA